MVSQACFAAITNSKKTCTRFCAVRHKTPKFSGFTILNPNAKILCYKIVIHGAIQSVSRLIKFLQCQWHEL
jgi:hypothetical protein